MARNITVPVISVGTGRCFLASRNLRQLPGFLSSRSRGTWLCKPLRLHMAPEGWKEDQAGQRPVPIDPADELYPEGWVSSREDHAAWAILLAKVYEVDCLVCGRCGSPNRVVAVITEPPQVCNPAASHQDGQSA